MRNLLSQWKRMAMSPRHILVEYKSSRNSVVSAALLGGSSTSCMPSSYVACLSPFDQF